jgi:hypothetical protein
VFECVGFARADTGCGYQILEEFDVRRYVFHEGMVIAGCPAVVSKLVDGAAAAAEGFYLAAGEVVSAVDMYVEGGCLSSLHAAKRTCDAMVDCMGFLRPADRNGDGDGDGGGGNGNVDGDGDGCVSVTWIKKDSTLSEYTFHKNMNLDGARAFAALTGPLHNEVGRCMSTVSKSVVTAPLVSTLETKT